MFCIQYVFIYVRLSIYRATLQNGSSKINGSLRPLHLLSLKVLSGNTGAILVCTVYDQRPFSSLPLESFVTSVVWVIPACLDKTIGANARRLKVDSEPEGRSREPKIDSEP